MTRRRGGIGSKEAAMASIVVLVVLTVGLVTMLLPVNRGSSNSGGATSSTSRASTSCVIAGQPGPFFLRVLSDSTHDPVVGAQVTAVNEPAYCNSQPADTRTSTSYTTNGTEWIELPSENNAEYSISVSFSGQTHGFTADLRPVSITCATIFMPSGVTNVTITEFGETCSTSASNGGPPSISSVTMANASMGGYPSEIVVNPATGKIYVADLFQSKLTVINASTYAVTDTITLPGTPGFGMAVDSKTDTLFVPSNGEVIEISGATDKIVGAMAVGISRLAVDPNEGILYGVGSYGHGMNASASLAAVNLGSNKVIANTSLDAGPLGVAVNPETGLIYVTACKQLSLACLGAEVLIINSTTHAVQSTVPLNYDGLNFNVVVDQATDMVYTMGVTGSNLTLVAIDGSSGAVKFSSAIGSSCSGAGGGNLAVNPASNQVYAAFYSQNFFLVIDGSTGKVVNMLSTNTNIQGVAFNPIEAQVYVTLQTSKDSGSLLVIPGFFGSSYVNGRLLQQGICLP